LKAFLKAFQMSFKRAFEEVSGILKASSMFLRAFEHCLKAVKALSY